MATVGMSCLKAKQTLEKEKIENAAFEARLLCQKAFSLDLTALRLKPDTPVSDEQQKALDGFVSRRIGGEPLQYILGEWEFMGLEFSVGKGVLIPRPETELLVEAAVGEMKGKEKPVCFDLCAGSGCVGLSVSAFCPRSKIYLVEKSVESLEFLQKNIKRLGSANTVAVQGDITSGDGINIGTADVIVSNPPYVETATVPLLEREVCREPSMALDGGQDGLDFYRVLRRCWLSRLNPGGSLTVECGEGQAAKIVEMFSVCFEKSSVLRDLRDVERVVVFSGKI